MPKTGTPLSEIASKLELWAGVECTVNRVGERYFDQLELTGHSRRVDDLRLISDLGIKVLRYPVLWERTAPESLSSTHWTWADERLHRLRELGIVPIVGLIHHGSGPRYTSLLDPEFPEKLAAYARAVAERYPWIDLYTPINEPLTTARFSTLYGHWYPHHTSDASFAFSLVNQIRGTIRAMEEINKINPGAKLVQTEDLGTVYSTRPLQYQADFENERRWLTWDLLSGLVVTSHPLRRFLVESGVSERELDRVAEFPRPPDLLGINHYVTSDRFLDHRLERYLPHLHGGNGRDRYVDIEAVRSEVPHSPLENLLLQVSARFGRALAITEAHLGCTRDEQIRWLSEVWIAAQRAKNQGCDLKAVTVWSLFGACDWDSLATQIRGHYEPGVFDVRSNSPRQTALAPLVRSLALGANPNHPVLEDPGWWHRAQRGRSQSVLLIVGKGTLGRAFARICAERGISYRLLGRAELDVSEPEQVKKIMNALKPWGIVNAAGYVRVDKAEKDQERCYRENVIVPANLARECTIHGIPFLTFSSDLVFDGATPLPYKESASVSPLSVYGSSKAEAENQVLCLHPEALVIRTSAFFGPWDEANFLKNALCSVSQGKSIDVPSDLIVSPTYVPDLVNASLDLLIDGETGRWHLANQGAVSWAEFAKLGANLAGMDAELVNACPSESLNLLAKRPKYSALGSERALLLDPLATAVERFVRETGLQKVAA